MYYILKCADKNESIAFVLELANSISALHKSAIGKRSFSFSVIVYYFT